MNRSQQAAIIGAQESYASLLSLLFLLFQTTFPRSAVIALGYKGMQGLSAASSRTVCMRARRMVQPFVCAGRHSLLLEFTCGTYLMLSALTHPHCFFTLEQEQTELAFAYAIAYTHTVLQKDLFLCNMDWTYVAYTAQDGSLCEEMKIFTVSTDNYLMIFSSA